MISTFCFKVIAKPPTFLYIEITCMVENYGHSGPVRRSNWFFLFLSAFFSVPAKITARQFRTVAYARTLLYPSLVVISNFLATITAHLCSRLELFSLFLFCSSIVSFYSIVHTKKEYKVVLNLSCQAGSCTATDNHSQIAR